MNEFKGKKVFVHNSSHKNEMLHIKLIQELTEELEQQNKDMLEFLNRLFFDDSNEETDHEP